MAGFRCDGHTGYAAQGADIVCSAVSALTQAAANGITEVLKLPAAVEAQDASFYVMLDRSVMGEPLEKAQIILQTMALGLRSIADTYGDYIKIFEREV